MERKKESKSSSNIAFQQKPKYSGALNEKYTDYVYVVTTFN